MDSWGSGVFGASRDAGARAHVGLDMLSVPGDIVVSPVTGHLTYIGIAYPGSSLGSIHLTGTNEHEGLAVKMLYVIADALRAGGKFHAGDRIGVAQDVSGYWRSMKPEHIGLMKNHVHLELTLPDQRRVDPAIYLPHDAAIGGDLTT